MMTVRPLLLHSLWAVTFASLADSMVDPARLLAVETPLILTAAATPTEQRPSGSTWVDDLERTLTTSLSKKYPDDNFEPYTQILDRIRKATDRGDLMAAKRQTGTFLKMVAGRAHGLGNEAAEELIRLTQRVMPEQEFGIVYPGRPHDP